MPCCLSFSYKLVFYLVVKDNQISTETIPRCRGNVQQVKYKLHNFIYQFVWRIVATKGQQGFQIHTKSTKI